MIFFPAIFIWGLVSTGLLIYQMTVPRSEYLPQETANAQWTQQQNLIQTQPVAQAPTQIDGRQTATVDQALQKKSLIAASERGLKSKSAKYKTMKFMVDDVFAVTASVTGAGAKGPFSITLDIENLTGQLERGSLWVRVNAVGENGQDVFLYSSPSIIIGSDGRVQNPKKGVAFTFQRFLHRSLQMYGDDQAVAELKSIEVGFDRRGRGQSVATVALQPQ